MNEQMNKALEPLKHFWGNTSKTVKKVVIGAVIVCIIVALVFSILLNTKEYVVIFDQLTETETSEILAKLQDMDVSVKVDSNGSIMVLKEDESNVRMALATEGYPKSGLSYYLIEQNSGMLTTDYERKQYVNMQLQERISASIKTLEGVKDAVVTITVPEEDVFYLQDKEKPSASVIIHMRQGNTLTPGQISGIQNLVAKSVSGLTKDNIALSDSQGNDLGGNSDSAEYSKIGITREIENDIKKKINAVLVGPYKSNQFKISVTATVDTDAMVKEETLYIPSPDGTNTGVISEEARTEDTSSNTQADGGIAGTTSNSEVPTYPTGGSSGESTSSSTSENIKYKVSETKSQTQKSGAKIEKISIGIAIDKNSFEPGERESITQLVSYAAGVSPDSITVQNFSFYSEEETPSAEEGGLAKNKVLLYGGIGGGVLLLLIALLVIMMMKKRKKNVEEEELLTAATEVNEEEALNEVFGEVERKPFKHISPVQDVRREQIKEFAKENPEIAAQMIKTWLKSENE